MGVVLSRAELVRGLEPLSTCNVSSVRLIFQKFEEVCPAPALWERAFAELFGCFPTGEAATKAFMVLDTDGNGLIDARESIAGLAIVSKGHLSDRMQLLFDIFDLNGEKELHFDECFLMLRRSMAGLRKLTGIVTPPEKVVHNMTKQIWKSARKHRNNAIILEDWQQWWTHDASMRSALKMVTWKPEEQRGLPTPDQQTNIDYTKSAGAGDDDASTAVGQQLKRSTMLGRKGDRAAGGMAPTQRAGQVPDGGAGDDGAQQSDRRDGVAHK